MPKKSSATLTAEVTRLLQANGYAAMPSTIRVGDVSLKVPGLWEGPTDTLDLAVVADRPSTREDEARLYWTIQRLTRALDAADSRLTITAILVGDTQLGRNEANLLELARVLVVDGSLSTDRMIGPALQLQLPAGSHGHRDGIAVIADTIAESPYSRPLAALLKAAPYGRGAVVERYQSWLGEAFQTDRDSHG